MEKFSADGVIIKTSNTGESDRVVWVLTGNRGIIRAFAKGARGTKNRLHGGTALFSYCNFVFYEKNNVYHINEAQIKEIFFPLRENLERLTLAQYFCEILLKTLPEVTEEEIYLRLLLNSLHFLCSGNKNEKLVKAVFELEYSVVSGYMPSLVACESCNEFSTETMYFDVVTGKLYCSSCGKNLSLPALPEAVISAMRHICFSPFSKIYAFDLPDELLQILSNITEKYLSQCFQQKFRLISYYNSIKN